MKSTFHIASSVVIGTLLVIALGICYFLVWILFSSGWTVGEKFLWGVPALIFLALALRGADLCVKNYLNTVPIEETMRETRERKKKIEEKIVDLPKD